ncbi:MULTISPECIES: helix-turn-helix domain-containing protein [Gordonia]|uniref:HTH cro/C1-type domain-containing protein n=2 Tax=Gordonia TaxID=2053 RepID=A0ABN3HMG0_9ACTN|nr:MULTISPECIES: helix-turn-helix transcriptional regulator [Gordonia]AUH68969.1 XRE family transcriptional regulator [Gordonia sp. YC-JH1]KJR07623.1 XRE family transcriptional regulator [Gordonia sihwensis]KXT56429.1 XRE family transcriptional regulator [Gordonia sp. QH-12]MBY4570718.1 transcriptional regulator [Gordonia sihwensis]WFN94811.1 helix-turn-helix transcriptional regulator [Gordonia sihwensis]
MTNYTEYKQAALADLTAAEREVYDQAYETAGVVMELAGIAYQARIDAGLTQAQLAERMGTTQSSVAAVENGSRTPTVNFLERLARACGARLTVSIDAA